MAKAYRKTAPKRTKRRASRRHGSVVKLAAAIAGRSIWTVYGVINGRVKSARVRKALDEAERRLLASAGTAA